MDIYGIDNVRIFFSMEIWNNLNVWKWDRLNQRFITPEIKLMKRLGKYDLLADILAMEQFNLQEELQEKRMRIKLKKSKFTKHPYLQKYQMKMRIVLFLSSNPGQK